MAVPRPVMLTLKAGLTLLAFVLLLRHPVAVDGARMSVWEAVRTHARPLSWGHMWPFLALAVATKAVGIGCAVARWRCLSRTQGLAHGWGPLTRTFLVGRFLGTFLPGTLGLDGYKLLAATRAGGEPAAAVAATAIEKALGLCGIMLTFLLAAPFGASVLGAHAAPTLALCVPVALVACATLAVVLVVPAPLQHLQARLRGRRVWAARLAGVVAAARRLGGRPGEVARLFALSLGVHFTTAALYFFTALAVGASHARFFEVVFASSIQILATVLSPLTVAGEGVREAVHALLLARHLGLGESILSAALGFWAAEALTLVGAYFWWREDGVAAR